MGRKPGRLRNWWEHNKVEFDDMLAGVMIGLILIMVVMLLAIIVRSIVRDWNDYDAPPSGSAMSVALVYE